MAKKNRLKSEAAALQSDGLEGPPIKLQTPPRRQPASEPDDVWEVVDDAVALGLGLLCVFLPRVVEPGIRDLFQLPKQLLMANGAAWSLALLALLTFMGRRLRLPKTPLLWPGLALCASIAIGVALAPEQTGGTLSIFARYDAHRWAAAAVLFGVTLLGLGHPRRLWYVVGGIALGGLWVALIGIGEQHNIKALKPGVPWAIISKPGSTFGNRNMAAELIVAVMPACYALLALGLRWWLHGRRLGAALLSGSAMIALLLLVYYLMLTVTRSAWAGGLLGLVGAGAAWALGRFMAEAAAKKAAGIAAASPADGPAQSDAATVPRPAVAGLFGVPLARLLPLVVAGGLVFGAVATVADVLKPASEEIDVGDAKRGKSVPALIKSFFDQDAQAYQWRYSMWRSSWDAMKAEPWGGGAGNWRVMYPKYVTPREKNDMFNIAKQPIRAHQDFLQFGVEFGFHGLLALPAKRIVASGAHHVIIHLKNPWRGGVTGVRLTSRDLTLRLLAQVPLPKVASVHYFGFLPRPRASARKWCPREAAVSRTTSARANARRAPTWARRRSNPGPNRPVTALSSSSSARRRWRMAKVSRNTARNWPGRPVSDGHFFSTRMRVRAVVVVS